MKSQKKSNRSAWSFNCSNIACMFMAGNDTTSNACVCTKLQTLCAVENEGALEAMMYERQD
jgi:hypothetical protein